MLSLRTFNSCNDSGPVGWRYPLTELNLQRSPRRLEYSLGIMLYCCFSLKTRLKMSRPFSEDSRPTSDKNSSNEISFVTSCLIRKRKGQNNLIMIMMMMMYNICQYNTYNRFTWGVCAQREWAEISYLCGDFLDRGLGCPLGQSCAPPGDSPSL